MPERRLRTTAACPLPAVFGSRLGCRPGGRPAGRANRAGRGLPRSWLRDLGVLEGTGAGRRGTDGRACLDEPDLLARGFDREGRVQSRVGPEKARGNHGGGARNRGTLSRAAARSRTARGRSAGGGQARGSGRLDCRRAGRAAGHDTACAAARTGRSHAPRSCTRHRSARSRPRRGASLDLGRGDVRARPRRPRVTAPGASADGRRGGRAPAPLGALCAHRDDEAALRRLLDPVAVDDTRSTDRRRAADRGSRLPAARTRASRPSGSAPPRGRRRLGLFRLPAADARRRSAAVKVVPGQADGAATPHADGAGCPMR